MADLPKQMKPMVLPIHSYYDSKVVYLGKRRSMDPAAIGRGEQRLAFKVDPIALMQEGAVMGNIEYTAILAALRFVMQKDSWTSKQDVPR